MLPCTARRGLGKSPAGTASSSLTNSLAFEVPVCGFFLFFFPTPPFQTPGFAGKASHSTWPNKTRFLGASPGNFFKKSQPRCVRAGAGEDTVRQVVVGTPWLVSSKWAGELLQLCQTREEFSRNICK